MPHRILILPNGTVIDEGHDNGEQGGNRQSPLPIAEYTHDHAPSEISIKGLSLEDANKVLKLLEKIYRK